MRFLDANIFIYAYYRPRRRLKGEEERLKKAAKGILKRVSEGEPVITTVVHLSEVANILKRGMKLQELMELLMGLLMMDNIEIEDVNRELYFLALELGQELELDPNDALAVEVMRRKGVKEIYTFDKDFDRVEDILRIGA
jgi:hypothetical protein